MKIGVDIDGVLMDEDTYRLDTMAKYCFENNLSRIDYPYKYESKCNWSHETKEDYRNKYYFEYVKNAPVMRYAAEVIKRLHDEGNEIIIITGRYKTKEDSEIGEMMRKYTLNWLEKNGIIYDEICYAKFPKIEAIKKYDIDIMIDDSPDIISNIIDITKVLCFDSRYNRDLKYENMTRVFSWYDIYLTIKEISKE